MARELLIRSLARRLLRPATLHTIAAALVAPGPVSAQSATPVITIEESIATLREMIGEVESGRTMILAPVGAHMYGPMVYVERDRVGSIAGWLVVTGRLDPDSIEQWTQQQIRLSRGALAAMKQELAEYEARRDGRTLPPDPTRPAAPAGPGRVDVGSAVIQPVYWPTPMDWTEVGGIVRGTYRIQCWIDDDRLPELRGTFKLELRGAGIVLGSFTESDGTTEAVNGRISQAGLASGSANSVISSTGWSAEFVRSGDAIELRNVQVIMDPGSPDARCDPAVVDQTS